MPEVRVLSLGMGYDRLHRCSFHRCTDEFSHDNLKEIEQNCPLTRDRIVTQTHT
jgi:hypothetical protein